MHEDRGCFADFVFVYHYTIGRQVLEGMDKTRRGHGSDNYLARYDNPPRTGANTE